MAGIPENIGTTLLTWEIPEYEKHERGAGWFTAAILIGLGLIIWSVLSANFLFAFFVGAALFLYFLQHARTPRVLTFTIAEDGLALGDEAWYPYKEIKDFWLLYEPPLKKLYITFKTALRPELAIPLGTQNPTAVRKALLRFLAEDKERESEPPTDAIGRALKI